MTKFGYTKLLKDDPDLAVEVAQLRGLGCDIVRHERADTRRGRMTQPVLHGILELLTPGDVFVAIQPTRISTIASRLYGVLDMAESRGARVEILDPQVVSTEDSGRLFVEALRISLGISAPRNSKMLRSQHEEIAELLQEGHGPTRIAKELGVSRTAVYRHIWRTDPDKAANGKEVHAGE